MKVPRALFALIVLLLASAMPNSAVLASPSAPVLQNPGFECVDGYLDQSGIRGMVAKGWTARILVGNPVMNSTQMWTTLGTCKAEDTGTEKLEGYDSNIFLAEDTRPNQDMDAPPFDVVQYQTPDVLPGAEYSLSAWMTSFCGGTNTPSDCPEGAYIAKMAGLDPLGGTDPLAANVQWAEDRRPHTEVRWANLSLAATAETSKLTVFLRINSPFHHHGNMAFADAVKLVRSPTSQFTEVSARGNIITAAWTGTLGEDIPLIPATNHKLSFEVQVRAGGGLWTPWLTGQTAGSQVFAAPPSCRDQAYQFRIRAWAIQPYGVPGASPNHHFVGVWHESPTIQVPRAFACANAQFLPAVRR